MAFDYEAVTDAIADITLHAGTKAVYAFKTGTNKGRVERANLPCRVIIARNADSNTEGQWYTLGKKRRRLLIQDLLLYSQAQAGKPQDMIVPVIQGYIDSYQSTITHSPTPNVFIETVSSDDGVYEYPQGSGNMYTGALMELEGWEYES